MREELSQEFNQRMGHLEEENKILQTKITTLERKINELEEADLKPLATELEQEISQLTTKVEHLEVNSRKYNLELHGIKETPEEDDIKLAIALFSSLGVEVCDRHYSCPSLQYFPEGRTPPYHSEAVNDRDKGEDSLGR